MSIPVVIAKNGLGAPVRPVDKGAPAMTVADNGFGAPIVISALGAPFVVSGLFFNIDDLFANGEAGVWFDPSPSTCFTDEAGTIPASVGDPVALMLDKSKGLELGPELFNGTLPSLEEWQNNGDGSWSTDGSQIVSINLSSNTIPVASSKFYELTFTVLGGPVQVYPFHTSPRTYQEGVNTIKVKPSATFLLFRAVAGQSLTVSNISIRELKGNHATQPTTSARPTYGIVPESGRRNLLSWTEDFSNSVWIKIGGTVSGQKLTEGEGDGTHGIRNPASAGTGAGVYTTYFDVKAAERTLCEIWVLSASMGAGAGARFNLATGEVVSNRAASSSSYIASSIEPLGDGVFRCSVTVNYSGAIPNGCLFPIADGTATNTLSYQGDGTSGIFVYKSQLEPGSTATPYQRVTSQYDVTEEGVKSLNYLSFDGVDDSMVTPTITPNSDKVQVFAGIRKLSDAAIGTVVTNAIAANSIGNEFGLFAPRGTGEFGNYGVRAAGSEGVNVDVVTGMFLAPETALVTGIYDLGAAEGEKMLIRRNGIEEAVGGSGVGTGLFSTGTVYLGARGSSLRFNGQIFGLITRFGDNLDEASIINTERYLADKTGVTL